MAKTFQQFCEDAASDYVSMKQAYNKSRLAQRQSAASQAQARLNQASSKQSSAKLRAQNKLHASQQRQQSLKQKAQRAKNIQLSKAAAAKANIHKTAREAGQAVSGTIKLIRSIKNRKSNTTGQQTSPSSTVTSSSNRRARANRSTATVTSST